MIAVTTNIESMELRRRQNGMIGYEEHPRAGTSDDVEAIFALFHRFLGKIFTLKDFKASKVRILNTGSFSCSNIPFWGIFMSIFFVESSVREWIEISHFIVGRLMSASRNGTMICFHSTKDQRQVMIKTHVNIL